MIFWLAGCVFKPPTVTYGPMEALPLVRTSIDRRWYVPVMVDQEPWIWFVDTGYAITTCDDDLAEELRLETGGRTIVRGENGRLVAERAELPDFELGGHTIQGLTCVVRDLDLTSSIRDPDEVHVAGVLGMDVFSRFQLQLDPEAPELRLFPPGTHSVDGVPLRSVPWDRRVRVPVMLDEGVVWPHVDTGTNALYLDGLELGLDPVNIRENVVVRGTGAREQVRDIRQYRESIGFAGDLVHDVLINGRRSRAGTQGLVGLSLLSRYVITFDFQAKRASFGPARWAKIPLWAEWRSAHHHPEKSRITSPAR